MDERYKHTHLFFKEDGHSYTDSNGNSYLSCTTFVHKYAQEFNKDYWLKKKADELGKSIADVKADWIAITNESCERGTKRHNYLEDSIKDVSKFAKAVKYYTDLKTGQMITVADIPYLKIKALDINEFKERTEYKYPKIYEVFDFYIKKGYSIYSEIGVFLIDYLLSGTIDVLCIRDSDFVILDWKTNKDGLHFTSGYYKKDKSCKPAQLTNNWVHKNEYLKAPLNNLPSCNGSLYTMQLNMYAVMVNKVLGIPCVGLGLCHIGSSFVLNKYGMPLRNEQGMYTIDESKDEIVNWYRIQSKFKESELLLKDRAIEIGKIDSQLKLF